MYNTKFDGWMFDAMADYSHEQDVVKQRQSNLLSKLLVGVGRKLESIGALLGKRKQPAHTSPLESGSVSSRGAGL